MKKPSSLSNDDLDAEMETFYNLLLCGDPRDTTAFAYCYHALVEEKISRLEEAETKEEEMK